MISIAQTSFVLWDFNFTKNFQNSVIIQYESIQIDLRFMLDSLLYLAKFKKIKIYKIVKQFFHIFDIRSHLDFFLLTNYERFYHFFCLFTFCYLLVLRFCCCCFLCLLIRTYWKLSDCLIFYAQSNISLGNNKSP